MKHLILGLILITLRLYVSLSTLNLLSAWYSRYSTVQALKLEV